MKKNALDWFRERAKRDPELQAAYIEEKEKYKCINCSSREFLEEFINPYNTHKMIALCYKCAKTPFEEFTNKEFMKPWWQKDEK